ncbi:MAG: hypothetical protein KDD41_10675 [Flavobacteriales bacterium]|nr:hypothetical protein [Flavobacteriales bacterium]
MVALGFILFFVIFFMAMWLLVFLFTVVVPGSIKLFLLNKFGPTWAKKLAGLEVEE